MYLIVVEIIFRTAFHQDTMGFVGPTIAAAGLTSLIPLTELKGPKVPLSDETRKVLEKNNCMPVKTADARLVPLVWIFILLAFLVWFWSCTCSIEEPQAKLWFAPKHIAVGSINYVVAMLCALLKSYL